MVPSPPFNKLFVDNLELLENFYIGKVMAKNNGISCLNKLLQIIRNKSIVLKIYKI